MIVVDKQPINSPVQKGNQTIHFLFKYHSFIMSLCYRQTFIKSHGSSKMYSFITEYEYSWQQYINNNNLRIEFVKIIKTLETSFILFFMIKEEDSGKEFFLIDVFIATKMLHKHQSLS